MAWTCTRCHLPVSYPKRRHDECPVMDTLFDAPRAGDARHTDPRPSKQAATKNHVARMTQKKRMLVRALNGPVTSHTVADITAGQINRASKRLGELREEGLLRVVADTPLLTYALTEAGTRDAELMRGAA